MSYVSLLSKISENNHSILCMGADPILERIPIQVTSVEEKIFSFYKNIIDAVCEKGQSIGAIKPNYAFYGQYGFEGIRALKRLVDYSKAKGLPVILDAKRGDIGKTSQAYAKEVFDFWGADAVTLSPYMGSDSLLPFINKSRTQSKGVYILARTSNEGAKDFQNLIVQEGIPLYMKVIDKTLLLLKNGEGETGLVVGATSIKDLSEILHRLMPVRKPIPLLIPGVGSQGGSAAEVVSSIIEAAKEIGLTEKELRTQLSVVRINSSSGINYAYEKNKTKNYSKAAAEAVIRLNEEINNALQAEGVEPF